MLLTPSRDADENLKRESIAPEKIRFVGNVMIDSLVQLLPKAAESKILATQNLTSRNYVAVTLHRPSNVDDPQRLALIMQQLAELARELPVVFPVHPRTKKMLSDSGFKFQVSGFKLLDPLGYLDFLRLQSEAALVITDSGGVQEETTFLGIPCLTVRPNTERPITITHGTNRLIDPATESLRDVAKKSIATRPASPPQIEFWDGKTAARICAAIRKLVEPVR